MALFMKQKKYINTNYLNCNITYLNTWHNYYNFIKFLYPSHILKSGWIVMMIRIIVCFLSLFLLFACQPKDKNRVTELIKTWDGKEILFPKKMNMVQVGDSIPQTLSWENYKILIYVDTNGCFTCKLHLMEWEDFMNELDSVPALFYFAPKSTEEVKDILKENLFYYPVYIDEKDSLNILNRFPKDERFHTFLLDRDNRVKAIGNPVRNPKIKELYLKVITGDTLLKKQAAQTTIEYETTVYDLGEFTPNESREAVFSLKNTGTQPLLVADVVTSCGCATPRYDKKPVNPGETINIIVEMKIKEEGYFEKTISVYCNIPDSPVRFRIKGSVVHEKE